jgi:hypothetical protein
VKEPPRFDRLALASHHLDQWHDPVQEVEIGDYVGAKVRKTEAEENMFRSGLALVASLTWHRLNVLGRRKTGFEQRVTLFVKISWNNHVNVMGENESDENGLKTCINGRRTCKGP